MDESDLTHVLEEVAQGDAGAKSVLMGIVYHQLKRMAKSQLQREFDPRTLDATALVHETYLRLLGQTSTTEQNSDMCWKNRRYFFAAVSEAMRRILIEDARSKNRLKRGGDWTRVEGTRLDEVATHGHANGEGPLGNTEILAVHEALDALALEDPIKAEVVKLRYFTGLTELQVGEILGISRATTHRYWVYAKAWLFDRLSNSV